MDFDDQHVDAGQLDDQRGGGRGRPSGAALGVGAGGLGIVGVIVAILFSVLAGGGDQTGALDQVLGGTTGAGTQLGTGSDVAARCNTAGAIDEYEDCYILKVFNENNEVWTAYLPTAERTRYPPPRLVYFTNGVTTGGCGTATSQTGPFYCPADSRVYLDLGFMQQLLAQLGADGRYAEAYVVAHEVGHHLQNVLGIEAQVRAQRQRYPSRANALSVRTELQADCFAGVWGALANQRGNVRISKQEYQQALRAAAAVGDDRIQSQGGGRVDPESFTHGTAAQRQQWFERGFQTANLAQCDTFAAS